MLEILTLPALEDRRTHACFSFHSPSMLLTLTLPNISFQDKAETFEVQRAALRECQNLALILMHSHFFDAQYFTGTRYQNVSFNRELFRNLRTAFV